MKFSQRIITNALIGIVCLLVLVILNFVITASSDLEKYSFATAYLGLSLIASTLLLGPLWLFQGKPLVISKTLRRDIGIFAAVISLLHMILGLFVHFNGRVWVYFFDPNSWLWIRHDLFGLVNYLGLLASLILLLLLIISNNYSLKKLGVNRWKGIQRWNYFIVFLVALHGFGYQFLESRSYLGVSFFLGILLLIILFQWLGFRHRSRHNKASIKESTR